MTPNTWDFWPGLAHLEAQMGAIRAQPNLAISALNQNASIAVYPGGVQDMFRPYALRHQVYFHNSQGFIKLALKMSVPIVPMISSGAHETLRVLCDLYPLLHELHEKGLPWPFGIDPQVFPIYMGLPWGLAVGPMPNIPLPVKLHTRICPPIRFERTGKAAARDRRYVRACYEHVLSQMQTELDILVTEQHRS